MQADPEKVSVIIGMKAPNTTELRWLLGAGEIPTQSSHNNSTSTGVATQELYIVLGQTPRRFLFTVEVRTLILTHYDPLAEVKVSADASSIGLGAVLRCWHVETCCFCLKKPVRYRASIRTNWKEALAAVWAYNKFSGYLLECTFLIETDHKPLVPLLGTKNLRHLTSDSDYVFKPGARLVS